MSEHWTAHLKSGDGSSEVSVCFGKPAVSYGWFGPDKLRIEFSGGVERSMWHAEQIAAALNAAGYDPKKVERTDIDV